MPTTERERSSVLENKRDATQYQILVQIAERQPAVSQQEIADSIGITSQAVSNYLQDLVDSGYVKKHGRGRYEVTKLGVDWLISQTEDLRTFISHVTEDIIGQVEVDAAVATGAISEGDRVSLSMRDGTLHATPGATGDATALAITDAVAGQDVGITDFEGVVDYELGVVTIVSIPSIRDGGSKELDTDGVTALATEHDLIAVAGVEATAALERAGLAPDIRFGSAAAVSDAATHGLDVLLLSVDEQMSTHTDTLRDRNLTYEVLDMTAE